MTIVQCPRCRDEVTVPAKASPRALVRCPLCLEEYTLREALAELPPTLIVIDGSLPADDEYEPAMAGAAAAHAGGDLGGSYELSGGGFPTAAVLDSSPAADGAVTTAQPRLKGKIRKRKEKSAIAEMIKVVMGGVVGLSLAIVGLWWIPKGWGGARDPANLGPTVGKYVPWIVPAEYRPQEKGAGGNAAGGNGPTQIAQNNTPPAPAPTPKKTKAKPAPADQLVGELPGEPAPMPNPLDVPSFDLTPTPTPTPTLPTLPAVDPLAVPIPEPSPTPTPSPMPAPMPAASPIPAAPDFQKAVLAATESLAKVTNSAGKTRDEVQQAYTDMHLAASEMGRVISYLSPSDPDLYEHVQTMRTFLGSLAGDPRRMAAVRAITDLQLPTRKADDGVFLAGSVKDFQAVGSLFECVIEAGKKTAPTPIVVVCNQNPQDFFQVGDEVLVVGRLIENPTKNLPGYEGSQPRVVLYGDGLAAPKAAP
ncbi:MAG: hypothetical protein SFU86_16955 [Pirellulaceae bacterium]|nr:hypothetical protein [Pirellulaceae bacterium]